MRRVALVTTAFAPAVGGVEHHVGRLAAGLVAAGDDVTVLTHRLSEDDPEHEVRDDGVRVRRFPQVVSATDYRWSAVLLRHLWQHRDRYDVVHAHSYHALAALNATLSGARPLVFTPHYHGTGHTRFRALLHTPYRLLGRQIVRRSQALICVSEGEADLVRADFPWAADQIVVIPNGAQRPTPSAQAAARSAVTSRDVVTVGRLVEYKGVDRLVAAVPHLPQDVRLVVVGDGPDRERLAALAEQAGVASRVRLLGRVDDDDLAAALTRGGVVASLSRHEAFGLCLADGLAAGAPVVASDIPAHREVLRLAGLAAQDVETSLVPAGTDGDDPHTNAPALAAALSAALERGRSTAASPLPTWTEVVDRTRAVYDRVARTRRVDHDAA